jgi:hypothetical protein
MPHSNLETWRKKPLRKHRNKSWDNMKSVLTEIVYEGGLDSRGCRTWQWTFGLRNRPTILSIWATIRFSSTTLPYGIWKKHNVPHGMSRTIWFLHKFRSYSVSTGAVNPAPHSCTVHWTTVVSETSVSHDNL